MALVFDSLFLQGMRKSTWFFIVLAAHLILAGSFYGCNSADPPESNTAELPQKKEIKMAKDSELALLMRQFTAETESIRTALEAGEAHPLWSKIEALHSATPTDKASSGPVFEGFSESFITAVKAMQEADSMKVKYFNAVIDRCMDCHTEFCPGPRKRIAKFYIAEH
jgi:hypothetical protein